MVSVFCSEVSKTLDLELETQKPELRFQVFVSPTFQVPGPRFQIQVLMFQVLCLTSQVSSLRLQSQVSSFSSHVPGRNPHVSRPKSQVSQVSPVEGLRSQDSGSLSQVLDLKVHVSDLRSPRLRA